MSNNHKIIKIIKSKKSKQNKRPNKKPLATYTIIFVVIVLSAFFFRFYHLSQRSLHHDEAVQFLFVQRVINWHFFKHNLNYHGPLLFFINALFIKLVGKLVGISVSTIRIIPALFSFLSVLSLIALSKKFGKAYALFVALYFAISPTITYYSRFNFHDPLLCFFFILLIISFIYRNYYLLAISSGLIMTTKEYGFIYALFTYLYWFVWIIIEEKKIKEYKSTEKLAHTKRNLMKSHFVKLIISFVIAILIANTLFSWFYTQHQNIFSVVLNLIKDYTRVAKMQTKPFHYFILLIIKTEPMLMIVFVINLIFLFYNLATKDNIYRTNPTSPYANPYDVYYLILLSIFTLILFSSIKYKTPWNLTNVLVPMILVSGFLFGHASQTFMKLIPIKPNLSSTTRTTKIHKSTKTKKTPKTTTYLSIVILIIYLITILSACVTSYKINFVWPDDHFHNPLAYVQASWQVQDIANFAKNISLKCASRPICFYTDEYWPLPFYLKNNTLYFTYNQDIALNYTALSHELARIIRAYNCSLIFTPQHKISLDDPVLAKTKKVVFNLRPTKTLMLIIPDQCFIKNDLSSFTNSTNNMANKIELIKLKESYSSSPHIITKNILPNFKPLKLGDDICLFGIGFYDNLSVYYEFNKEYYFNISFYLGLQDCSTSDTTLKIIINNITQDMSLADILHNNQTIYITSNLHTNYLNLSIISNCAYISLCEPYISLLPTKN